MKEKLCEATQNWSMILYPESCEPEFINILDEQHIQFCVSPLHDRDVNEDGELKKPHYHLMIHFDTKKSFSQVQQIQYLIGGTMPIQVKSQRGTVRYLVHKDNPEKAPYKIDDIITRGGYDISKFFELSQIDTHKTLIAIKKYIRDNAITEFFELVNYADDNEPEWSMLLEEKYTLYLTKYLQSYRFFLSNKE